MSIQSEINRLKQNVSNAFTAIGNKGGTVPSSKISGNLVTAINSIPEGVTVQRKTGTFKTSSNRNTKVTVNCGFQPDIVIVLLKINDSSGTWGGTVEGNICVAFSELTTYDDGLNVCSDEDGGLYEAMMSRSTSGFTILLRAYTSSWGTKSIANETFNYVAIKYT